MEFTDLIAVLGRKIGIDIAVDDDACRLEVDGAPLTIQYLPEFGKVCVTGVIGQPPPERLEALWQTLLRANHLFQGTGGATLSLDPETDEVCLCRAEQLQALDDARFLAILEDFVNMMETWAGVLSDYRPDIEEPSAEGSTDEALLGALGKFDFIQA